jgi:hypothetical protein
MEVRRQVGSTQPCWTAETNGEVAVDMGTNTSRVTKSGSGTAVHAGHARLQQHARGREGGQQYEDESDKTRAGSWRVRKQASAGRGVVGEQGMQQIDGQWSQCRARRDRVR